MKNRGFIYIPEWQCCLGAIFMVVGAIATLAGLIYGINWLFTHVRIS